MEVKRAEGVNSFGGKKRGFIKKGQSVVEACSIDREREEGVRWEDERKSVFEERER